MLPSEASVLKKNTFKEYFTVIVFLSSGLLVCDSELVLNKLIGGKISAERNCAAD